LYVSDSGSCTLRKIDLDAGQVSTLAGQLSVNQTDPCNNTVTDGDGPTTALLRRPGHMATDGQFVYFVDGLTVRKYNPTSHAVTTLVGDNSAPADFVDGLPPA